MPFTNASRMSRIWFGTFEAVADTSFILVRASWFAAVESLKKA